MTSFYHGWLFLFLMTIDPLMLQVLLQSAEGHSVGSNATGASLTSQLLLIIVLSISMLTRVSAMEMCYFHSARVANNVRSVVVHAIFRKALVIPDHELDTGKITNLMATDADKLGYTAWLLFSISQWTWAIVSLPVVVYFLYKLVGVAAFLATAVILIGSAANRWLSMRVAARTKSLQKCRDQRSKLMIELIRGIRTVKLQALEPLWCERISASREYELQELMKVRIFSALNSLVGSILSTAVPVTIFACYTLVEGKTLDSATAFTTLAWIATLRWSIQTLPGMYSTLANMKPSIDRLSAFLSLPSSSDSSTSAGHSAERLANATPTLTRADPPPIMDSSRRLPLLQEPEGGMQNGLRSIGMISFGEREQNTAWLDCFAGGDETQELRTRYLHDGEIVVRVEKASFGYIRPAHAEDAANLPFQQEPVTVILQDVNIQISKGQLVMVAGPVGAGKSTLLASLACARPALGGCCEVFGRRAYASQKPFLMNASIQQNILFGSKLDLQRYEDAVFRAALRPDLQALPEGDSTLVGENGVQLSGGQKARVALARALYADAHIVLLDDVLSAVDAHTGKFLWENCIVGGLLRRGKTVVLVSHQLQYLSRSEVSSVILLRGGKVWLQGPWLQLESHDDELLNLVHRWDGEAEAVEPQGDVGQEEQGTDTSRSEEKSQESTTEMVSLAECQEVIAQSLRSLTGRCVDSRLIAGVVRALGGEGEALEGIREGNISWADFKVYLGAFGSLATVSILAVLFVAGAFGEVAANIWLSVWTRSNDAAGSTAADQQRGLMIYAAIDLSAAVVACFQALMLTVCSLAASRSIHGQMLHRVLAAPLSFFDSTPTGRLMNRFLQDLQNVDSNVPDQVSRQVTSSLSIISQLSLILVEAPWVLVTVPMLIVPYYAIFIRMRIPNRDSRRIESVARSPVYAHFSDTLVGRDTVRAFGAESRFQAENLKHIETMATACYGNNAVAKWAQILTTQWGCALYFGCGIACVVLAQDGKMPAGTMGLVLLYAAQLQRAMMDYMMSTADLEKQFVSVERTAEYTRLESEPEVDASSASSTNDWCSASITFENVSMRYRLHRPLVLNNVSLHVPSGCKVALCGRTGCGKSTLFAALSRLYPIVNGRILIGNSNSSNIQLSDLRAEIRVVSQDAFLVSGTLRQNLILGRTTSIADEVIWHCLSIVGMSNKIRSLPHGLDAPVEENGQNFSVGERQLLSLARVLLPARGSCSCVADWRPPKLLLCDEATASVDLISDQLVHEVLLALQSTVLMICHRLQYIHRFQLVVVMDAGKIMEMGPASELLANASSRLSQLCAEAGIGSPRVRGGRKEFETFHCG